MRRFIGLAIGGLSLAFSTVFLTPVAHADNPCPMPANHATNIDWANCMHAYCASRTSNPFDYSQCGTQLDLENSNP